MADIPEENGRGNVATSSLQNALGGGSGRQPSIHLIKIPERDARVRALRVLIALEEGFVRMHDYYYGLSSRQVAGLEAEGIPFERMQK